MRAPGSLRLLSVLLPLVGALSGCGRETATPLAELRGRAFGLPATAVLAGPEWKVDAQGLWRASGPEGSFGVLVASAAPDALVVVFRPPRGVSFGATWDGAATRVARRPGGAKVVRVPVGALAPGYHDLRLTSSRPDTPLVLRSVEQRSAAGQPIPLAATDLGRDRALGQLLDLGLGGSGATLRDGFATVGPWSTRVDLGREDGGTFVALVANLSSGRARFGARRGTREAGGATTVELGAGAEGVLRLEVPKGERQLELSVDGPAPGQATLWGGPFFVPARARVPAVVVITLDTVRRDALGAFGGPAGATPNLDRLAHGATVYARASSSTSWTLPAHASLFTGLYPVEHRAGVSLPLLGREFETLAEQLRPRYVTLGLAGGALLRQAYGVGQGFGIYEVPEHWEVPGRALVDRSLGLLSRLDGLPFFLFVNLFDAHYPYKPPADSPRLAAIAAATARIPAGSRSRELARGDDKAWRELLAGKFTVEAAGVAALRAAYAAEVAEVDRQAGRLLDELERRGLLDSALIVVVADHGEFLGERGLFSHAARLDPELVDIPMIVKYPGQHAGRRVELPVSLVDLFPTVLRAAGVVAPASRGILLTDEGALAARAGVLFEETEYAIHPLLPLGRLGRALTGFDGAVGRRVEWRAGEECHDGELPQRHLLPCTAQVRALHAELRAALALREPGAATRGARDLDPAEAARLRALGYL